MLLECVCFWSVYGSGVCMVLEKVVGCTQRVQTPRLALGIGDFSCPMHKCAEKTVLSLNLWAPLSGSEVWGLKPRDMVS